MSLSDELARLGELHQRGTLSDAEFDRAKASVLEGPAGRSSAPLNTLNALRRSRTDSWFGGVCGGLAQASGTASWLWRMAFTLLVLCAGSGAFLYLLFWVFVPLQDPWAEPLPNPIEASP